MARIRSIHPGILTDESFMMLTVESPLAIALMLGLWMEADDAGTFEWKPITLKARCLPAANTNVSDLLDALQSVEMVKRFEIDGKPYGVVRNFVKYQRPKDPKCTHPSNDEMQMFAGFSGNGTRPNASTGRKPLGGTSEPLPNEFGSGSEIPAQMEDVGCRRKDEEERISSLRSDSADAPQSNSDLNSEIQIKPEPIAKPKTAKPPKPVKTALDQSASPTADDRAYAANLGMTEATLANEWEKFKLNHIQRQTRAIDWAMTWQTWARNWVGYGARNVEARQFGSKSPVMNVVPAIDRESSAKDVGKVWIKADTPEWDRAVQRLGKKPPNIGGGWYFDEDILDSAVSH